MWILLLMKMIIFSLLLTSALMIVGSMFKKKSLSDRELQSTFECGFSSLGESRLTFSVHFFLIAVVFVIFDVELIMMFPLFSNKMFSSSSASISLFSIFVVILLSALFNEWNNLALEWTK